MAQPDDVRTNFSDENLVVWPQDKALEATADFKFVGRVPEIGQQRCNLQRISTGRGADKHGLLR